MSQPLQLQSTKPKPREKPIPLSGNSAKTIDAFKRAIELGLKGSDLPETYLKMVEVYFDYGHYDEAERCANQALETATGDNSAKARYTVGMCRFAAGDTKAAIAEFEAALGRSSSSYTGLEIQRCSYNALGDIASQAGENEKALECYDKVVQIQARITNGT